MPQLAPMNWILLNFLFWGSIMVTMVSLWWVTYSAYAVNESKLGMKIFNFLLTEWTW
uniref:ATP synthase F0 subunit 8 n=1 Tax=Leptochiton nexus TaxID=2719131 RepID=A0A6H1PGK3_9MOLL|nr:ATP synthase F0 subunit 8 [Leptochiton nexus]QIZ12585.1 ATP synthase F0 subunit 8 [Leptochiton nexus]